MPRGGFRDGGGRPTGSVKAEGVRKQKQMRAYDDEWELIQAFAKMVKHGDKEKCREFVFGGKDMGNTVTFEIMERYGNNKNYCGGSVKINANNYIYVYTLSYVLGRKTEQLYIAADFENAAQPCPYWVKSSDEVKGALPQWVTEADIAKAEKELNFN